MIGCSGVLQIVEPKIRIRLDHDSGKVIWILLKLALGYLLIGYTGGVSSSDTT